MQPMLRVSGLETFYGDLQALHGVARPAEAVAGDRKALLGGEHAVVAPGGDVTLEIGLVAEQPEPVLDLPFDPGLRGLLLRMRR